MSRSRLRKTPKRPFLTIDQILSWADDWFAAHRRWPNINSGLISGTTDDTWARIDDGLRNGHRSLPKGTGLSLARLLAKRRGVRNSEYPPPLSTSRIIAWAKGHKKLTGHWPTHASGPIENAPGETWLAIDMALRKGRRGLPAGSSLARLLARNLKVRNPARPPKLTVGMILRCADAYYVRHGKRPTAKSGPIPGTSGETWLAIDKALAAGRRGLAGGSSLAKLLDARRPKWLGRQWAAAQSRRRNPLAATAGGRVGDGPRDATSETWR